MEAQFRRAMAHPEPEYLHLLYRLRACHGHMTFLKATNILAEIPSKRLLMRYIQYHDLKELINELMYHFRFARSSGDLANILRSILHSDREHGIFKKELSLLQDSVLRSMLLPYDSHL
jgi:hypothetical protein